MNKVYANDIVKGLAKKAHSIDVSLRCYTVYPLV